MTDINEVLKNVKMIAIDDLLLDPNNPRFMHHTASRVPKTKIADRDVQDTAFAEMHHQRNNFEIGELVDAIMQDGFMEVDKLFVEPVAGKYLVVEGNRRVTALKTILLHHTQEKKGFETLPPGLTQTGSRVPCVVIDIADPIKKAKLVRKILGLRHHGSILPWKPLPASFNLYDNYMHELCDGDSAAANNPENFTYSAPIAKKIAALFSVRLKDVRNKVRMYRSYQQLVSESREDERVARPETFSKLEETLTKDELVEFFGYNEDKAIFSENGIEKILDLYFGLRGKEAVILQASAGDSNIRDFAYVVSEGTAEDVRRITEGREKAGLVCADVKAKKSSRTLQNALDTIWAILSKIQIGDIGFDGFAPNEVENLKRIELKLNQLKDAAQPRT